MRVKSLDQIARNSITPESNMKVVRIKETITMVGKELLMKQMILVSTIGKNLEDGKENLQTDVMV